MSLREIRRAIAVCLRKCAGISVCLMSIGCGTPASSSLDGIEPISRTPLTSEVIFNASAARGTSAVFEISGDAEGKELRLLMSHGVVWVGMSGGVVRSLDFMPNQRRLTPVRSLRDDSGKTVGYAGFEFQSNAVVFFDTAGREVASQPCRNCWDLTVGDVGETGGPSLVVRSMDGKAARSFDAHGVAEETYASKGFLTSVVVSRIAPEPASSVFLYVAPDPDLGRAVRVLRPDGVERAQWPIGNVRSIVASTASDGTASILSVDSNTLVEQDALTGKTLSRTDLEGSSQFRAFYVGRWREGTRIVVFTGGGYLNKYMVILMDAGGSIVFREIGEGRAYGLNVPAGDGQTFYVAIDRDVKRYSTQQSERRSGR